MKPVPSGALLVAIACLPALAAVAEEPRQLGAHEHGAARLDVVLDDHHLVIALQTPAANVLGFEHRPTDDAEREAVASGFARLRDGDTLFVVADEAGCRLSSATIESPLAAQLEAGEHHEGEHHEGEHHEGEHHEGEHHEGEHHEGEHHEGEHHEGEHHEGEHHEGEHHEGEHHEGEHHEGEHAQAHADIDATWTFHCDTPAALGSVGVRLFEHFDGFEAIDVQLVGPAGQAAFTLTPDASTLNW